MKHLPFLSVTGFLFILLFTLQWQSNNPGTMVNPDDNHDAFWHKIDSLENKGLPRSALSLVDSLYTIVKNEKNTAQQIKCLLYAGKYVNDLEEDGLEKAIVRFKHELKQSDYPLTPLLQSLLGEMYFRYLDHQYWKLAERRGSPGIIPDNFLEWTPDNLIAEGNRLVLLSIKDDRIKQYPINKLSPILLKEGENWQAYRPTLFDFLAHRALDILENERHYLSKSVDEFILNNPEALLPAEEFVNYQFTSIDSSSNVYQSILLWQRLLAFRIKDKDKAPFIDAELKRLRFVFEKGVFPDKEGLYERALQHLAKQCAGSDEAAEVFYQIAALLKARGDDFNSVTGTDANRYLYVKVDSLCREIINQYPDSRGAGLARNTLTQLRQQSLDIITPEVNEPDKPFLAQVQYKNLKEAHFRLIKMDNLIRTRLENMPAYKDRVQYLLQLPIQKKWQEKLPDPGDFRVHQVEIMLEALKNGLYLILVADDSEPIFGENHLSWVVTHISELGYWNRSESEDGSASFFLCKRQTGEPVSEAVVKTYERTNVRSYMPEWVPAQVLQTDNQGFVSVKGENRAQFQVSFSKGKDELYLQSTYYHHTGWKRSETSTKHTLFLMDRSIYRPGQSIFFKGILLEKDVNGIPKIADNKEVEVTLLDANQQKVETLTLRSNRFGTINGVFISPQNGLGGQMSINCTFGRERHYFRVEAYKRPRFEIQFEKPEATFKLGDEIELKGFAKLYAGPGLDKAKVTYRVVREVKFPLLYRWWMPPLQKNKVEIARGVTECESDGSFYIPFRLQADLQHAAHNYPVYQFSVITTVTDVTGETHEATFIQKVSHSSFSLSLDLEKNLQKETFGGFDISTVNFNEKPVSTSINLSIEQLQTPTKYLRSRLWQIPDQQIITEEDFKKDFPNDPFQQEDLPSSWQTEALVYKDSFICNGNRHLILKTDHWAAGHYKISAKAIGENGETVFLERYFVLFSETEKNLPYGQLLHITPKQQSWQPGDTATLILQSSNASSHFLVEWEHRNRIIKRTWVKGKNPVLLTLPITEAHRGGLHCHIRSFQYERPLAETVDIPVPWSNKELKLDFITFRDKLKPGEEEEWILKISGPDKERVAAELAVSLYDASLDVLQPHAWQMNVFPVSRSSKSMNSNGFAIGKHFYSPVNSRSFAHIPGKVYPQLDWFGFQFFGFRSPLLRESFAPEAAPMADDGMLSKESSPISEFSGAANTVSDEKEATVEQAPPPLSLRKNLKETVFFYPDLQTDIDGNVVIKFTMNEALTRWKFLGLAHTTSLQYGLIEKEVITQKELMILPHIPRFLREGDRINLAARVNNLSEQNLNGKARIELFDALSLKNINEDFGLASSASQAFFINSGESADLSWELQVPEQFTSAVGIRMWASTGDFADGEENILPVLTNRMLVTETLPLAMQGKENKTFRFEALEKSENSNTLLSESLTIEFTSNPIWYAIQALPYLMESGEESTEQLFNRYFGNTLSAKMVEKNPEISRVYAAWEKEDKDSENNSLLANLDKNSELKSILLEETPWVVNALQERAQKQNFRFLFDDNKVTHDRESALRKLKERQMPNGGFVWFPGGSDNWYITQYLLEGFGYLKKSAAQGSFELSGFEELSTIIHPGLDYVDKQIALHYQRLEERVQKSGGNLADDHLDNMAIHYLYMRSFFTDKPILPSSLEAVNYYLGQAEKYALKKGIYQQGMLGIALHRRGKNKAAAELLRSLKERAIVHPELGMYWKAPTGYYWYERPIETQAMMINAFHEIARDTSVVEKLCIWLLKNKQTNHWSTGKSTIAAVHSLLQNATNGILDSVLPSITLGGHALKIESGAVAAGSGYFKQSIPKQEISTKLAQIEISNPNPHISWGAVYWQYFEDLDKITGFRDTPLKIEKKLYVEKMGAKGPILKEILQDEPIKKGEKVIVRLEVKTDRPMEFVHIKDMRGSGLEPKDVLSNYHWQGGIGYYQRTADIATHFYLDRLPRGTWIFEYPLFATQSGRFSNGVCSMQCLFAPEFSTHTAGQTITILE